ncbi:MAG: hypothetical protein GOV02_01240 [Candidatus Aenigmarchaeota archaeon]|nr:hypothetical protein [Candidatus Aenigmarchaeota archaeon]
MPIEEMLAVGEQAIGGFGIWTKSGIYKLDIDDPLIPLMKKGRYLDVVPKSIETSELTIYDKDKKKELGHGISRTGLRTKRLTYLEPQNIEDHMKILNLPVVIETKRGTERHFFLVKDVTSFNDTIKTPLPNYNDIAHALIANDKEEISFEDLQKGRVLPAMIGNSTKDDVGYTYYRFEATAEN